VGIRKGLVVAIFSVAAWLVRTPLASAAPVAEVSPNSVPLSAGPTDFTYDIKDDGAAPLDRVTIAIPGAFSAASLVSVKVNGAVVVYADQSSSNTLAFLLASPAAAGSSFQVVLRATPPSAVPVAAPVTSTVDFSGD